MQVATPHPGRWPLVWALDAAGASCTTTGAAPQSGTILFRTPRLTRSSGSADNRAHSRSYAVVPVPVVVVVVVVATVVPTPLHILMAPLPAPIEVPPVGVSCGLP